MAIKVKPAAEVAAKWAEVTPGRARFYEQNAPAAAQDWEAGASAAVDAFRAGVTAGDIGQRYAGGVRGSAEKYRRNTAGKGKDRFGPGVRDAVSDYSQGVQPYLETIAGITLPPRAPRGDPANMRRSEVVAQALARRRLAALGAG